jgi:cytochrome c2
MTGKRGERFSTSQKANMRRVFGALLSLQAATQAFADDRERLFTPCRACHSLDPAQQGMAGPNLAGVVGRAIGGDPDFDYAPALRTAREQGLSWDARSASMRFAPTLPQCFLVFGCRCAASPLPMSAALCCAFSPRRRRAEG